MMVPVTRQPKGKRKTFLMPEKQGEREKPREKRAMREGEHSHRSRRGVRGRRSREREGGGCIPTPSAPPSLSHSFPALECVWPYSIPLGMGQS